MDVPITAISNVVEPVDITTLSAEDQAAVRAVQQQADTTPGGKLGKDEFLNLLVTQMANQDPMNPMDSTESIAQLAQFSALEQMQNVGDQIAALRQASGMTDALLLQGQTVDAVDGNGTRYTGTVDSAIWGESGLTLTIGGVAVPMANLVELRLVTPVGEESTEAPSEEASEESTEASSEETSGESTEAPSEAAPGDLETLPEPVAETT